MRHYEKPVEAPYWLTGLLNSVRKALSDIWETPLRLKNYTTADLPDPARYMQGLIYDETEQKVALSIGSEWRYLFADDRASNYESHLVEISSDETTALTAGAAKKTIRWPYKFRLEHPEGGLGVRAHLATTSSSGAVSVDINQDGASILSTILSIDQDEKTSVTAGTPAVLSNGVLEDDAEITFDIDAAGTGAAGLKVWLIGYQLGDFGILYEGDMNVTANDLEMLEGDMTDGDDILLQEAA